MPRRIAITTPPDPDLTHDERDDAPHDVTTTSSTHLARCGTCGTWLHVDEDELIASLDESPTCWTCGVRRPDDGPGPA